MLERYKKQLNGEKKLAELLETVTPTKQKQIVAIGLKEDHYFLENCLQYVIEWEDILKMPPLELSELMHAAKTKPNVIAVAISDLNDEEQKKFLVSCERELMGKVKDAIEYKGTITLNMIHSARTSLISLYRQLINSGKLSQTIKNKDEMLKKMEANNV